MRRFSLKLFLNLLVITCLGIAVWDGYVLFTHQTNPAWGVPIFLAALGVLIWNVSILRSPKQRRQKPKFKWVFTAILVILLVCAFGGVQPISATKDSVVNIAKDGVVKVVARMKTVTNEEAKKELLIDPNKIYPGQYKSFDKWLLVLDGSYWKGSTLVIDITITNQGPRRTATDHWLGYQLNLAAIDSTNKMVSPEGTDPIMGSPYHKEYYPKESWSGSLTFKMSPYSGKTKLYTTLRGHAQYFLFDLGSPPDIK